MSYEQKKKVFHDTIYEIYRYYSLSAMFREIKTWLVIENNVVNLTKIKIEIKYDLVIPLLLYIQKNSV